MSDQTLILFLQISKHRVMDNYLPKIRQCLNALSVEQLWEHEIHEANSIGGILLHIREQLNRHAALYSQSGIVSAAGIEDYFPDMETSSDELLRSVEQTFADWSRAMDDLLCDDTRTVDVFSIYHLVEHTSYHLGQIVDRVQRRTGVLFHFVQSGMNEKNLRNTVESLSNPTDLS